MMNYEPNNEGQVRLNPTSPQSILITMNSSWFQTQNDRFPTEQWIGFQNWVLVIQLEATWAANKLEFSRLTTDIWVLEFWNEWRYSVIGSNNSTTVQTGRFKIKLEVLNVLITSLSHINRTIAKIRLEQGVLSYSVLISFLFCAYLRLNNFRLKLKPIKIVIGWS